MSVAIVTGGSRGLGRALTRELSTREWFLVIDARGAELSAVEAELGSRRLVAVAGDVADPQHRQRLVDAAERLGGVDLLVNNASDLGPSPLPPLRSYPLEALRRVYEVDVLAPLDLVQRSLPSLVARQGVIVNVSSDAAVEAYEGWGGYGSAKSALDQLSAVLGVEEPDVRVYAFDPGDMRTAMHQAAFPGEDISDRPEPETVVPALLRLVQDRPASGRYRASDLLTTSPAGR